jgi:hypothetical protein
MLNNHFKPFVMLMLFPSNHAGPGSFARKLVAGTRRIWPRNKYRRPILLVKVPIKKANPMISKGSVTKASPTELRMASMNSIYYCLG